MMENIQQFTETAENIFTISVPIKINRRGGKTATMILPKNIPKDKEKPYYDQVLIRAFAKAYKWQKQMDKQGLNINKLAAKENISDRYVSRILRLNFLAPGIVIAILEGKQPRDLKLQDLTTKAVPELWDEQKSLFGF